MLSKPIIESMAVFFFLLKLVILSIKLGLW
jgi:hypothetical protein